MVQRLQMNLDKWEKLHSILREIKNIYIDGKHLGEVHRFTISSFNCGQLQTVLFKVGLYRIAPLKFENI